MYSLFQIHQNLTKELENVRVTQTQSQLKKLSVGTSFSDKHTDCPMGSAENIADEQSKYNPDKTYEGSPQLSTKSCGGPYVCPPATPPPPVLHRQVNKKYDTTVPTPPPSRKEKAPPGAATAAGKKVEYRYGGKGSGARKSAPLKDMKAKVSSEERRFDPTGYDKDLAEMLGKCCGFVIN